MDDALTLDELRTLAAVLHVLEQLDPSGARANEFAVGIVDRVRELPAVEPQAPYREQAKPSVELDAARWADQRRWAVEQVRDPDALRTVVQSVQRDEARAIIFALAYEAAVHCAITPREAKFLALLEDEWNLSVQ